MLFSGRKYDNWKAITESDFVTLFIKTWFTYIATLREICPDINVFTEDGKARGDKPFLNAFNDRMLSLVRRKIDIDEIAHDLFSFYPICMNKVINVFPQYFFQTFYRYNEQFSYSDETIIFNADGRVKERWQIKIKTENRHLLRLYLGVSGNLFNVSYNEKLQIKVDLKSIVYEIVVEHKEEHAIDELDFLRSIYDKILEEVFAKTTSYIATKIPTMSYNQSIKAKIHSGCERMVSTMRMLIDNNFKFPHDTTLTTIPRNSYAIIEQQPFPLFYQAYKGGQYQNTSNKRQYDDLLLSRGLLWFSGFVYSLRNALFHEIIDPLDEEWQTIFKAAYLILKPITDICIDFLNSIDAINEGEDTRILDFIEQNSFSCIDRRSTHTAIEGVSDITVKEWTIENGVAHIKGTVEVALNLQYGSEADNKNGDGLTYDEVIICEYTAQLDENFDLVGNSRDGYSIELSVVE